MHQSENILHRLAYSDLVEGTLKSEWSGPHLVTTSTGSLKGCIMRFYMPIPVLTVTVKPEARIVQLFTDSFTNGATDDYRNCV